MVKVAEANNTLRVRQAELDQEAEIAEKTAAVRSEEAKVEAQRALESKRVEREMERLRADVIEPANAARIAAFAQAEAEAAPILERGKSQVEVLRLLYEQVQSGGEQAFAVLHHLSDAGRHGVEGRGHPADLVVPHDRHAGVESAARHRLHPLLETGQRP